MLFDFDGTLGDTESPAMEVTSSAAPAIAYIQAAPGLSLRSLRGIHLQNLMDCDRLPTGSSFLTSLT